MTSWSPLQDLRLGLPSKAIIVILTLMFLAIIANSDAELFGPFLTYLYASIPFGWMFAKIRTGKDISKEGSKNLGVANSFNVAGYSEGLFTIATEASKAVIPLTIAYFFFDFDIELCCALIAGSFLGANFSLFMKLEGGMGVTIALWSLLIISPFTFIAILVSMFVTFKTVKDSYYAALLNFALAPFLVLFIDGRLSVILLATFIGVIFFIKYRRSMDEFRLREKYMRNKGQMSNDGK